MLRAAKNKHDTSPNESAVKSRQRLGSTQKSKPKPLLLFFCSFGNHWMFGGCRIQSCSIPEKAQGQELLYPGEEGGGGSVGIWTGEDGGGTENGDI